MGWRGGSVGRRVTVGCESRSVLEARVLPSNIAGEGPPSLSSAPLVCGTEESYFASPPEVNALSSASFAITWARGERVRNTDTTCLHLSLNSRLQLRA